MARIEVPMDFAAFPAEAPPTLRSLAAQRFNVAHWTEIPQGGHSPAWEAPDLFGEDIAGFFAKWQ